MWVACVSRGIHPRGCGREAINMDGSIRGALPKRELVGCVKEQGEKMN